LTTSATIDVPWQNFYKSRVWDKVSEGNIVIFGDTIKNVRPIINAI